MRRPHLLLMLALATAAAPAAAQEGTPAAAPPPALPTVVEILVLDGPPQRRGRVFYADPIEQRIIDGRWAAPQQGDSEPYPDGRTGVWKVGRPLQDGKISGRGLRGTYIYAGVDAPADGVWILRAIGHSYVYVNGARRVGDPYGNRWPRIPVRLHRGRNHLLFRMSRWSWKLDFEALQPGGVQFSPADRTLPTFDAGQPIDAEGAIVVQNGRDRAIGGAGGATWAIAVSIGMQRTRTPLPRIEPCSARKVTFQMHGGAPAPDASVRVRLQLVCDADGAAAADTTTLTIPTTHGIQVRKVTFRSAIDGSLQYYAVRPSSTPGPNQALFLSLHGAGVEARGQAAAYSTKSWGTVVAATNRRPFGFDWEQWGRQDAIEVLEHATKALQPDPSRVYLTGHSMGGHGTWQVGVLFPDHFAAIGPSAGWISFRTYGGRRGVAATANPIVALLSRASSPSQTLTYKRNYAQLGIYILHGDADDNVPVTQAREMRKQLAPFHHDFRWHEEPGKKHWWDSNKDEPGADCVDWAPMFEFFARRRIPARGSVRRVQFTTPSPGISSTCHWVRIEQQEKCLEPSSVDLRCDPHAARITGTTANVARLSLDVSHLPGEKPIRVLLDGQPFLDLARPASGALVFVRSGSTWTPQTEPGSQGNDKNPRRYGPFKRAFDNHFVLVYGTHGTKLENAWARRRARYDAETWWYRGNGSVDVFSDTAAFVPSEHPDCNVICYGNAETNAAITPLLGDAPFALAEGTARLGDRELTGTGLAMLACYPRSGTTKALVAVIGGTDVRGMRATDTLPLFSSGVAYPDCTILDADVRTRGIGAVRVTGYFGNDWSVEHGEWAWRK